MSQETDIFAIVPFEQFQYKTVEFPAAGVPIRISHDLKAASPEDVVYFIVRQSADASISDAQSLDAYSAEWRQGSIVLQSNVGSATATILLAVPRRKALA